MGYGKTSIIPAAETTIWRSFLSHFKKVDVCQLPEYHLAYQTRFPGSKAVMWTYEENGEYFAYPFFLTPVELRSRSKIIKTTYNDISSVYGYSGPLSTIEDKSFLDQAWYEFSKWTSDNQVIAEFIRFSIFADNKRVAHRDALIEANRPSAVSILNAQSSHLISELPSKTRNMIRKAENKGLVARELTLEESRKEFISLYNLTMDRNNSPAFFYYSDEYYDLLYSAPAGEVRVFGTFFEHRLISVAMALIGCRNALYHLGASLKEFSHLGAGNLVLWKMSQVLKEEGVYFLNIGGGRTRDEKDPLFLFKRNNATSIETFYIGKRIIDPASYLKVQEEWQVLNPDGILSENLIFYR